MNKHIRLSPSPNHTPPRTGRYIATESSTTKLAKVLPPAATIDWPVPCPGLFDEQVFFERVLK